LQGATRLSQIAQKKRQLSVFSIFFHPPAPKKICFAEPFSRFSGRAQKKTAGVIGQPHKYSSEENSLIMGTAQNKSRRAINS
jgi:hypothetical protein